MRTSDYRYCLLDTLLILIDIRKSTATLLPHRVFTALHGMQTRSSDENSVCLSVKRVLCGKMEARSVQIFMSYERSFSLVF